MMFIVPKLVMMTATAQALREYPRDESHFTDQT